MSSALCIGNFDGVHRGHQLLIDALLSLSREAPIPLKTIAINFNPHPKYFLNPDIKLTLLSSQKQKEQLLLKYGIDTVDTLDFNQNLSELTAEEFFHEYLLKRHDPKIIVIGNNFFFGKNKSGDSKLLKELCLKNNILLHIQETLSLEGQIISSSVIRGLIEKQGNVSKATQLLGRNYSISDIVKHGNKRGRTIGFPTANLYPGNNASYLIPKKGVYITISSIGNSMHPSMTNVGFKPTVSKKNELVIESHLLNFDGDLYGKTMTVEFRDRIRDEITFSSIEQLKQQLQKDRVTAKRILGL